jgi:hypothetical protein
MIVYIQQRRHYSKTGQKHHALFAGFPVHPRPTQSTLFPSGRAPQPQSRIKLLPFLVLWSLWQRFPCALDGLWKDGYLLWGGETSSAIVDRQARGKGALAGRI